jgi:hypothetical protein
MDEIAVALALANAVRALLGILAGSFNGAPGERVQTRLKKIRVISQIGARPGSCFQGIEEPR